MFNVESANQQIEKNKIESSILEAKIKFWAKLTGEMDFTDYAADNILNGCVAPSVCTAAEHQAIVAFRTKITNLETRLYAIA